jgi:hypothetical protein
MQALEKVQRKGARFVTGENIHTKTADSPRQKAAVFVLFVVGSDFNESFGV